MGDKLVKDMNTEELERHRIARRRRQKRYRTNIRKKLLRAYGAVCACCGEDNPLFLTIDHINNDGADHKRSIGSKPAIYKDILDNGDTDTYQTLCYNCNCGRHRNGGVCPHLS